MKSFFYIIVLNALSVSSVLTTSVVTEASENSNGTLVLRMAMVTSQTSRYLDGDHTIITESTVVGVNGISRTVVQLGGTVDGIGMSYSHSAPVLPVGRRIELTTRPGLTTTGTPINVVVSALAPSRQVEAPTRTARYGVERTRNSGTPLWRANGCLHIAYDAAGTSHIPGDIEFGLLDIAFLTWVDELNTCGALSFSRTIEPNITAHRDGLSTVVFRHDSWCRPATTHEPKICYPEAAAAVTRLIFIDDPRDLNDGMILEADIDFNANYFALAIGNETSGEGIRVDLRSAATHEAGHFLGLTHNCWNGLDARALDHAGASVPDCADVADQDEYTSATMFPTFSEGEVHKRTLGSADVLGGCAISSGAQAQCNQAIEGGCSTAKGSRQPLGIAIVLVLLAIFRRRQRFL